MIAPRTAIGARPHRVRFENPGPAVSDGDGGYTQSVIALRPPELFVEIRPATAADLERSAAGTVLTLATHIVTGPWHPGVTTETRIQFGTRELHIAGVVNVDERNVEMILFCTEAQQ